MPTKEEIGGDVEPLPDATWLDDVQAALAQEQRRVALWALPVVADADIPFLCKLAPSVYHAGKHGPSSPPTFTIGRRRFAKTSDLRRWIDERAAAGATPVVRAAPVPERKPKARKRSKARKARPVEELET
jgi:hypothetical protein